MATVIGAVAALAASCGSGEAATTATSAVSDDAADEDGYIDGPSEPADEPSDNGIDAGPVEDQTTTETATTGGAPSAEQLREIVLAGWEDIFAGRFDELIPFYTEDCRSRVTAEDFDATLGEGMRSLETFGINLDDIELDVRIDDFVEGESAGAVTIATLPDEDPSEDPAQEWIVEDGEWRNPDCEDIAGFASGQLDPRDVGGADNPAAIGSLFDAGDWRAGVIDVVDAVQAGTVLESAGSPASDTTWLMVTYQAQYFGTEIGELDPFIIQAVGSSVYSTYEGDCALDSAVVGSFGWSTSRDALPGESLQIVNCIDVPTDEVDELIFVLEDAFSSASEIAFTATGAAAPVLPTRDVPAFDLRADALAFGDVHDFGNNWTVTVIAVVDGVAEGLISEWSDEAPEGSTYPVAIYEATYTGPELTVSDSLSVDLIGASIYDPFQSACFVDDEATEAAYQTSASFEFASGETYRKAVCATAPADSVGELVIAVEHFDLFGEDAVLFAP